VFQKHKLVFGVANGATKRDGALREDFVFQKHKLTHSATAGAPVPARARASFRRALIE
jgi:hypothetical protein